MDSGGSSTGESDDSGSVIGTDGSVIDSIVERNSTLHDTDVSNEMETANDPPDSIAESIDETATNASSVSAEIDLNVSQRSNESNDHAQDIAIEPKVEVLTMNEEYAQFFEEILSQDDSESFNKRNDVDDDEIVVTVLTGNGFPMPIQPNELILTKREDDAISGNISFNENTVCFQ